MAHAWLAVIERFEGGTAVSPKTHKMEHVLKAKAVV